MMAPECPGKLATLAFSFRSQIFTTLRGDTHNTLKLPLFEEKNKLYLSLVPVPNMRPSGWNWAQVRAARENRHLNVT